MICQVMELTWVLVVVVRVLSILESQVSCGELLYIYDCVERVHIFTFLGTTMSADLPWTMNTKTIIKRSSTCTS